MPPRLHAPTLNPPDVVGTTVDLSWTPKGHPSFFQVQRDGTGIAVLNPDATTYTDTTGTAGATYVYRIRAFAGETGNVSEEFSNEVTAVLVAELKPITASTLTGSIGNAQCTLTWTAVANATSYELQRKTGAGSYAEINDANVLTFSDTGRTNGTAYVYRVRGTAGANNGPWSNEVTLTPAAAAPIAPTLLGTAGNSQNSLDWDAVANASTYRVRRGVAGGAMNLLQETSATDYIDDTAVNDTTYQYNVRGVTAAGVLGAISNTVDLTPLATLGGGAIPEEPAVVGYAAVAGVTGGTGGTTYTCSTWAQFRTALEASGPRIINLTGSNVFDGAGADFSLRDSQGQGNVTIDGTNWTGSMKDYKILWRISNVIIKQVAWRPGEGSTAAFSADRRAISFNPTEGSTINRILLDHCSFAWGPDVILSFLNGCYDVTIQYCVIGPALYKSNIASSPNGYGPNVTDTSGSTLHTKRITFYRNLMIFNYQRNLRAFGTDGWDVVNNAVYGWGASSGHGNPRGANVVGNMYKKGPATPNSEGWVSELGGAETQNYHTNNGAGSVYFPDAAAAPDRNIGITAAGGSFTLVNSFAPNTRRTTSYDGGVSAASHGGLTVAAANATLFNTVANAAGRTHQDVVDTAIKAHAVAGTESTAQANNNHYYNGQSTGIPPHPTW